MNSHTSFPVLDSVAIPQVLPPMTINGVFINFMASFFLIPKLFLKIISVK